jgi:hypothetical protein
MRMNKRRFLLSLAAGLLACGIGSASARAGPVMVTEAEGTFNFVLTVTTTDVVQITYSDPLLTKINNALIPTGAITSTFSTVTIDIASTSTIGPFTAYTSTSSTATKSYGTGVGSILTASLTNTIDAGSTTTGFLNLSGAITGVPNSLLETTATDPTVYDFSPFASGGSIALTYNKVLANFADVIATGGTVTGTGGFTETVSAVPEPASMALLGIGFAGFLAFRRYFKHSSV